MLDTQTIRNLHESIKGFRVLYVDDDELCLNSTTAMLSTLFDHIDTAVDGKDAWRKYNENVYDIIITDVVMPNMDGIELVSKIREIDSKISILILSAYTQKDFIIDSIRLGVDGYLLKPIVSEQFIKILMKIVEQEKIRLELLAYQENLEKTILENKEEMIHKYLHEYNTNLPNYISLQRDLEKETFTHMLLLDISHFSNINRVYGKEFANIIITNTAEVLKHNINESSKLYKTESDRFVILVRNMSNDDVVEYCNQLVSFFDQNHVEVNDSELAITFNIGVSKISSEVQNTIIQCEYALDKSKNLGSRHFEIYSDMHIDFENEKKAIYCMKKTRELIMHDRIEPYFQPIKDISTDKIVKFEVLARGSMGGQMFYPENFIPQAVQLGLVSSITKNIITKSFDFFEHNDYPFSINITKRDLLEDYLLDFLKEKTAQYNIEPSRIIIEVLENITVSRNNEIFINQLDELKKFGCKVAIDDFGLDNSNFSRLLNIDIDYIKLDAIFIKDLKISQKSVNMAKAIVQLSKTLGIQTIAEYVEDEELYAIVKECGIDYAQGYYVGEPKSTLVI